MLRITNRILTFAELVFNMIKNRIYTILLFSLFTLVSQAQEIQGPYFVYTTLKNIPVSITHSNSCQIKDTIIDPPAHGNFVITGKCDPLIVYTPDTNFIGRDTITYEYEEYPSNKTKYRSYVFIIVNSKIELVSDYYIVNKNSDSTAIKPLLNDISSLGTKYLKIKTVSSVNRLNAFQSNDTVITFWPVTDSVGLAYISYTVCDTFNTCVDGNIVVNVIDSINLKSDSLYVGIPKNVPVTIPLPQKGYTTVIKPKKGIIQFNSDSSSVVYKPFGGIVALDTFKLIKNNISKQVFVEIYYVKDPSKITVDDVVFTPKDSTVLFNVSSNDIFNKSKNYNFLVFKNPNRGQLVPIGSKGEFKYIPEAGYEGVQSFTYKVCPNGLCEYGEVKIFIGNWEPDTRVDYQFSTYKNVPIVVSYHIPIDAYNFSSPDTAYVKSYPGWDTVELKYIKTCTDTVIGYNLLIYYPPKDFEGTRSFTVNYCIPSTGQCVKAKCTVSIKDSTDKKCSTYCVGDCVWPGDVNLDGEVTMPDFLQIGYNLGNSGTSRSNTAQKFTAMQSLDWNETIPGGFADMKHADTNGDSKVDCSDTTSISNFYRKHHSLIPKPVYDRGDFPFILKVLTPNATPGQIALIEVQLGDDVNPVINLGGYSYELDYNTDVVNESSLAVIFYQNRWVTLNSALMNMYKKPWDGRLESGFVRANGNRVSGKGGVEVLSFIVEDDLGGFRKGDQIVKIPFYFKNVLVLQDDGSYVQLPDQVAYITLGGNSDSKQELNPADLLIYPNPTDNYLNVHLNGNNQMLSMKLYNLDGSLVKEIKNSEQKHHLLDVQNLQNGLYLLRTETLLGPISKKIEVYR